jgi:translocation-and-assembly-module (TAM) inner membrane subunit TamB-like protein
MIRHCLLGLIMGLLATLWFLHYDTWIHFSVGTYVLHTLEKALGGSMTGSIRSLRLINPSIELEHIYAASQGTRWSWYAQHLIISWSWFDLLMHRMLALHIEIYQGRGNSAMESTSLGLWDFIETLRKGCSTALPIVLKSLIIHHGSLCIFNAEKSSKLTMQVTTELKKTSSGLRAIIHTHDMQLLVHDTPVLERGNLEISLQTIPTSTGNKTALSCSIDGSGTLGSHHNAPYTLHGLWHKNRAQCNVTSVDKSYELNLDARIDLEQGITGTIAAHLPISMLHPTLNHELLRHSEGMLDLNGVFTYTSTHDYHINGSGKLSQLAYRTTPLSTTITGTAHIDPHQAHGALALEHQHTPLVSGQWHYAMPTRQARLDLSNESNVTIPGTCDWCLPPHEGHVHVATAHDEVTAAYTASVAHKTDNHVTHLSGSCALANNRIHATVDATLLQWLCALNNTIVTQVEGGVQIEGLLAADTIYGALAMSKATLRIPQLQNVLHDLSARFCMDFKRKRLMVSNLKGQFYRGLLQCQQAVIWWDDAFQIRYAHIPISLDHCFINWTRDFFAIVSGSALFKHYGTSHPSSLRAHVLIDRAQLKYNIFSSKLSREMLGTSHTFMPHAARDIALDIDLLTKDPVRIKTSFLETNAKIGLHLGGTLYHPQATGAIELLSGEFTFPYKKLPITKGLFRFVQHLDDPTIHVTAKNRIKRYQVALHITGSVIDPHVALESWPLLTEEQILGLLLVGSEQESLSLMIPSLVANNLKNLIFSADQSTSSVKQYFYQFLKPLRYIHVVPSFTDQTARGGVRAGLEVEITDRLRAYLQKNFSLTEDTRLEVEYLLSDEVRVKGVRDEHGDIGAEVEMRWKF